MIITFYTLIFVYTVCGFPVSNIGIQVTMYAMYIAHINIRTYAHTQCTNMDCHQEDLNTTDALAM